MDDRTCVKEGEEFVLALYFNTYGFGFAYMKNPIDVIERGQVTVKQANNAKALEECKNLICKLKPQRIIIEDYTTQEVNKSERIIKLLRAIRRYANEKNIPLSAYTREYIRNVFSMWEAKTRWEIAKVISKNTEAFSNFLFEEPKYPKTEHNRSSQFDAASLGITHYYNTM